jgi:hypothetical protein
MTTARIAVRATCRPTKAKMPAGSTIMSSAPPLAKPDRIRVLNDNFRSTFVGGRVVMTQGVEALPVDNKVKLLAAVRSFNDFDKDNDPYGEHDFGSIELENQTWFFKLDYYSKNMEGRSEDPSDQSKTARVLTIMRADEY